MSKRIILYLCFIFVFIIFCSLISSKLDRNSIRKKQKKILKRKGYSFDVEYIGGKLTKYDLFLDTTNKKIFYFNKNFSVYNYQDVHNIKIDENVEDGRYIYIVSFSLKNQDYKVTLKGNINEKSKIKYEELISLLHIVEDENKKEEQLFQEKQAKLKKEEEKKEAKKVTKKETKAKATKTSASTTRKSTKTKETENKDKTSNNSKNKTTKTTKSSKTKSDKTNTKSSSPKTTSSSTKKKTTSTKKTTKKEDDKPKESVEK